MSRALVSVASAPMLEMGEVRHLEMRANMTLSEMIAEALPCLPARHNLRVLLTCGADVAVVHPDFWHCTRPKPGVRVVLRLTAQGDDALRSVLTVVVSVAAMALGQFWAAAIIPTAGVAQTAVAGLITAGLTVAGTMLLNALIPIQTPQERKGPGETYAINGWQNTSRPGEPIPWVSGRMRMAPDFVGMPYTTIFGDDQYVTALLSFGYGPLEITDIKIGETPIDEYDHVELQLRQGYVGDDPITVYPKQVLEQREGVELTRPKIDGQFEDRPIIRQTASNALEAAVVFAFPAGLFTVNDDGETKSTNVTVRIEQRLVGAGAWEPVIELQLTAKKRRLFFRQYRWTFPSRGRWELRILKLTPDDNDPQKSRQINVAAIQSFRPEYPINFSKPLALVGIRVKATDQLSGQLDTINAVVHRRSLDWSGSAWEEGLSRNPAAAYRDALQGPQHPFPVPDEEIDLEQIEDWHDFCAAKGLKYDHIHFGPQSLSEMLMTICAAGRATPRQDGMRWGVVIDRPGDPVVDHISPRNSADFRWSQTYFDPPDAFRVAFQDETNDWEPAERIVPWPGHTGPIDIVEELPLAGKTDPDEIWIEARRRQYELMHRATSYTALQDAGARVATRGDLLMASYDVLDRLQVAARVTRVEGRLVELDTEVSMDAGERYGVRFHAFQDEADSEGSSVTVEAETIGGSRRAVKLVSESSKPRVGHLIHFGPLGSESLPVKLRGIEPGTGFSQVLHMVPAAPEIDTLTDAEVPPAWDSAVGDPISPEVILPEAPIVDHITSTVSTSTYNPQTGQTLAYFDVEIGLLPGATETVPLSGYDFEYQIAPSTAWTHVFVPAASGLHVLSDVDHFADLSVRARAIGKDGTRSAYTTEGSVIGDGYVVPGPISSGGISVAGGPGHATVTVDVDISDVSHLQFYRVPSGDDFLPEQHAVGGLVSAHYGGTYTLIDGDDTRVNDALNAGFYTAADWAVAGGWAITGGVASHTAGAVSRISQAISGLSGVQRIGVTVSGRTAGSVTPVLTGATEALGSAISADGLATQTIDTASGSGLTGLAFEASVDFDGTIDDVVLFTETPGCVPSGHYDYFVAPISNSGGRGSVSGPFSVFIY